jgi:hypothetical protein
MGSTSSPYARVHPNQVENEQAKLDCLKAEGADSHLLVEQQQLIAALEMEFDRMTATKEMP